MVESKEENRVAPAADDQIEVIEHVPAEDTQVGGARVEEGGRPAGSLASRRWTSDAKPPGTSGLRFCTRVGSVERWAYILSRMHAFDQRSLVTKVLLPSLRKQL